jgi:hypothetical protein
MIESYRIYQSFPGIVHNIPARNGIQTSHYHVSSAYQRRPTNNVGTFCQKHCTLESVELMGLPLPDCLACRENSIHRLWCVSDVSHACWFQEELKALMALCPADRVVGHFHPCYWGRLRIIGSEDGERGSQVGRDHVWRATGGGASCKTGSGILVSTSKGGYGQALM